MARIIAKSPSVVFAISPLLSLSLGLRNVSKIASATGSLFCLDTIPSSLVTSCPRSYERAIPHESAAFRSVRHSYTKSSFLMLQRRPHAHHPSPPARQALQP